MFEQIPKTGRQLETIMKETLICFCTQIDSDKTIYNYHYDRLGRRLKSEDGVICFHKVME